MDHNDENLEELQDFSLDDILNEFHDAPEEAPLEDRDGVLDPELEALLGEVDQITADVPGEIPAAAFPQEEEPHGAPVPQETEPEVSAQPLPQTEDDSELDALSSLSFSEDGTAAPVQEESGEQAEPAEAENAREEIPQDETIRLDDVPQAEEAQEDAEAPTQPPLVFDPQARLRELKHKLVSGPEKRYYELSEQGLGRLQASIIVNIIIVVLCAGATVLFAMDLVPEDRMRLLIFSQVLAMLVSALLGASLIIDGLSEIFRGRFTVNTMMALTFAVCCVDAVFCLQDLRVPCCAAFSLEMTMALCARYQERSTEMGQMDTLRKAVKLHSLVKVPDYYNGAPGFLRSEGELEDFWDVYHKASTPEKFQSFYAFVSFLLCIGIAAVAGMLHDTRLAVQVFATSLLVAVPAGFFVALTRPAAILERRLHMVGTVLCGWQGVKGLSCKAAFPLTDSDLFPLGSTRLNGVKFYSERDPDMIVSYTSSLILEAGGGLVPVFQQLMTNRGVAQNLVINFHNYGNGGVGGEVCGESVLVGSLSFLQEMGVEIPEGTMVNQAVYAAIDGQLCAVVAISYAKMRSSAAGMVTLCGYRKLTPVMLGGDFILTENFIRSKFGIKSKRLVFPDVEIRQSLAARQPEEGCPSLAIATRNDLVSYAYAVTGAKALRTSSRLGVFLHLAGGILGMLIMLVLAILGSTELLTPANVLLYQLVWLVPGLLITEWARNV